MKGCYDSISKRETIITLQESFETMKNKYKETGNEIYKTLMKDIQRRLKDLGE